MKVLELGTGPGLATEQFEWTPACVFSWYTIENVSSVLEGKWPEFDVRRIRPVKSRVVKHGSGN